MSAFDLDIKSVRKLAALLKETGLSEIEYAQGTKRIRCVRNDPPAQQACVQVSAAPAAPEPPPAAPIISGTPVSAPMVGTVYLAPEPGAPPFVKEGDRIKEGDTLLIIEAMKVMNPIKAPKGGTVSKVLVTDARPVEFGETLLVIA